MIRRTVGTLLILIGLLGMLLSAVGVVYTWRAAEDVSAAADDTLLLLSSTLSDIDRSLEVTSSTLDGAITAMDGLYTTTLEVSATLSGTVVTIEEMAELTEDDLPRSVEASLLALDAVVETAAIIDQLLSSLQQLGIAEYDPAIPLDQAVAEAAVGLETVPQSLRAVGAGLRQTNAGLEEVQDGIAVMGDHVVGIRQNAVDAEEVVDSHRITTERLQAQVRAARQNLDRPIQTTAWVITLILTWIGLSQMAILRWGIGLWQQPTRQAAQRPDRSADDRD